MSFFLASVSTSIINTKNLVETLLCFLTLFLSAILWSRRQKWLKTAQLIDKLGGPPRSMLLGNLPDMYKVALNPGRNFQDCLQKFVKEHGPIYRIWNLSQPLVYVADTKAAIKLLRGDLISSKSSVAIYTAKVAGGFGFAALPPHVHAVRRKQWMPSFTRKQIESSIKCFIQQAIKLCHELGEHADSGKAFDFVGMSIGCTFRIICYSAFGQEYMNKLPDSVAKDHIHDLHTFAANMTAKTFKPWLSSDFIYFYLTREGRETRKSIVRGNMLTKAALRSRQASIIPGNNEDNKEHDCFMDNMLELLRGGQLTEAEVIEELNVFITGGYDTTGLTICYVLYFLSLHPEHQEKCVEELCEVLPEDAWENMENYEISSAEIKQTKYLDLCIKETLRLFPVFPMLLRRTSDQVELEDRRIIPDNVDVYVLLHMILRDPKYFPEPNKFVPERHLEPSPAFIPFSLGSRNCIGQVHAMYEMKVILSYLLMTYRWETMESESFKPVFQTVLVPENGMHFKITKRNFSKEDK